MKITWDIKNLRDEFRIVKEVDGTVATVVLSLGRRKVVEKKTEGARFWKKIEKLEGGWFFISQHSLFKEETYITGIEDINIKEMQSVSREITF